ncbi:MAG: hypothetical protein ACJASX_001423 [Limisphaerales bacterium]
MEIGRVEQRQEVLQKSMDVSRPSSALIAAAGLRAETVGIFQPDCPQLMKAGAADSELARGAGSIQQAGIEIFESSADKLRWEAEAELFLFKGG